MKRAVGGLLLVAVLTGLGGCGGGGDRPAATASPSPERSSGGIGIPPGETPGTPTYPPGKRPMTITLVRTGGVAGVDHRIQVSPDGAWTYSGDGKEQSGQLTDREVSKLQSLAMDERLQAEAKREDTADCADGFRYRLTAGSLSMSGLDCGGMPGRPAFEALVDYLTRTTPM